MNSQHRKFEILDILTETLISRDNSFQDFVDFDKSIESGINIHRIFKTERKFGVRTLCVVLDLPSDISDAKDLSIFFNKLRNSLSKKYAKFPFWKELGTFTIILCDNPNYVRLKNEIYNLKDVTGFHMNTMLGTFLVNVEKPEYHETKTWGLIFSGEKYGQIKQSLTNWISQK